MHASLRRRLPLMLLAGASLGLATPATWAEITFDNEADDNHWSSSGNWDPDTTFEDGSAVPDSALRFDGSSGSSSEATSRYSGIDQITFAPGLDDSFTVTASDHMYLGGVDDRATIAQNADGNVTLKVDAADSYLHLEGDTEFRATGGDLTLGGQLHLDDGNAIFNPDAGRTVTVEGSIHTIQSLIKTGEGTLRLNNRNGHNGGATLRGGTVVLGHDKAFGYLGGDVRIAEDTTLATDTETGLTLANKIILEADVTLTSTESGNGNATWSRWVELSGSEFRTITNEQRLTISAAILGEGGLIKEGSGLLKLAGNNRFNGDILVNEGNLFITPDADNAVPYGSTVTLAEDPSAKLTFAKDETIGGLAGGGDNGGSVFLNKQTITIDTGRNKEDYTFSGTIEDQDYLSTLVKAGEGRLTLDGDLDYGAMTRVEGGTLSLGSVTPSPITVNGGELNLDGAGGTSKSITLNGGRLTGSGSAGEDVITAGGDIDLSGNQAFNALRVGRDFVLASGDTLFLDVGNMDSDGVGAGGSATLEEGSTVKLVRNGNLKEGEVFNVIRAATVTNNAEVDASDFGEAEGFVDNELDIQRLNYRITALDGVGPAPTKPSPTKPSPAGVYEQAAANSVNAGIGRALDSLEDAPELTKRVQPTSDHASRFVETVNDSGRTAAISQGVTSEVNQAMTSAQTGYFAARRSGNPALAMQQQDASAFGGARPQIASAANDPQVMAAMLGQTSASPFAQPATDRASYGAFAKAFGLRSDADRTDDRTGYQADTYGLQSGLDWQLNENALIGVSFAYAHTDADLDQGLGGIDSDSYRVGPYASFTRDNWFLDASATYGFHDQDATRNNALGGSANADFQAHDLTAYLGGGRDFTLDSGLILTPTASLRYTYHQREAYEESGPGALQYDERNTHTLHSRIGGAISYAFEFDRFTLVPEAALGWEHEYLQDDEAVQAQFAAGSTAFDIDTAAPDQDSAYLSLGASALLDENVSTFLKYEGNFSEDAAIHGVSAGLTYNF